MRGAKSNLGCSWRAIQRDLGQLHQSAQSGLNRVGQRSQTQRGECAILAGERNRIGDRGDGDQLEKRWHQNVANARAEGFGVRRKHGCGG